MLRGVGLSLAVLGAVATLAALQPIVHDMSGGSLYWIDFFGQVYTLAFALCGVASGVILYRRKPATREPLSRIGVFGVYLTAPLVLAYLVLAISQQVTNYGAASLMARVFFRVGWDEWWPPQESLFCNTLMFSSPWGESLFWAGRPLHEPLQVVCGIGQSVAFWTWLPFAVCLRAIWGRPRKWVDTLFAWIAGIVAVAVMIAAAETAWQTYERTTVESATGDILDYLYIAELRWYAFYALAILLLVTLAMLLSRRAAYVKAPEVDPAK